LAQSNARACKRRRYSIGPKSGMRLSGKADAKTKSYNIEPNTVFGPML